MFFSNLKILSNVIEGWVLWLSGLSVMCVLVPCFVLAPKSPRIGAGFPVSPCKICGTENRYPILKEAKSEKILRNYSKARCSKFFGKKHTL